MATTTGTAQPEALAAGEGVRRRDFINIAAVSFAAFPATVGPSSWTQPACDAMSSVQLSLAAFDRTFAVTYALQVAAILIGLFGISGA